MWDWLTGGETTKEAVKFLTEYADYLQFQDLFSWLWNSFVWGVIKTLYALNTGLEKLLLQSFDVGDFLKDQGLTDLQTTFFNTKKTVMPYAYQYLTEFSNGGDIQDIEMDSTHASLDLSRYTLDYQQFLVDEPAKELYRKKKIQ